MSSNSKYDRSLKEKKRRTLKRLEKQLPDYCIPFLDEKELVSQINTVISYTYDLITFFSFLYEKNPMVKVDEIRDIPPEILENLTFEDINEYQRYLSFNDGEFSHMNEDKGIARRMAALRGFFEFACTHGYLKNNPTVGAAKRKKTPKKDIIRLSPDEVKAYLDTIEGSDLGSDRQKKFLQKTSLRDFAILTLLLNTGIRVSECVGLDVKDINFRENSFTVLRKGGNTAILYFNDDVSAALMDYIENERSLYDPDGDIEALFLSLRRRRISVRAVQNMVKKFGQAAVPDKHITPHKMRSTYGTALYRQSGDIRLVADVLGHKDINTTAKHYAAMEDEHRRQAAKIILYEDDE
ncbi:MAG: tyrosine-type recombinase/integrase [Eubacterium sp.]|nr:tyrosine-type recombinase/integrase [Eubacterium sp.]